MIGTVVAVYLALACLTVDTLPAQLPAEAQSVGQKGAKLELAQLPVICRQINEWGKQYPSLNP